MSDAAISLTGVGKRYTKYEDQPMLLNSVFHLHPRTRRSHLWALRDCTVHVDRGECIGVLGRNGSGKSTMLQMMAGVTSPTEGRVEVTGRVAPLVSVGVGFHPELTGRENVYVNGTILGLTRREIETRFDDIVEFAEIEDFIDTPVKFYSSGMYVRLGFSVAVNARPDVLLVDEVLAVGDFAFQMKCFDRMLAIKESGTTIVVVSHNLGAVRNLCERSILLHAGALRCDAPTPETIATYHEVLGEFRELEGSTTRSFGQTIRNAVELVGLTLRGADGEPAHGLAAGEPATLSISVRALERVETPRFGLVVVAPNGAVAYADVSDECRGPGLEAGETLRCDVSLDMRLAAGEYQVRALVESQDLREIWLQTLPVSFYVAGRGMARGVADLQASFDVARTGDAVETGT